MNKYILQRRWLFMAGSCLSVLLALSLEYFTFPYSQELFLLLFSISFCATIAYVGLGWKNKVGANPLIFLWRGIKKLSCWMGQFFKYLHFKR